MLWHRKMYTHPPDGGVGWIVVAASFCLHAFMDGLSNAYGAFLPLVVDRFNVTRAQASTAGSLLSGLTFFFGPLASLITSICGCRTTALIGSAIAFSGMFATAFATSIVYLYISLGFVTAAGFGLAYFPSMVAVNEMFDRKQSLAVGLAVCGTGFGTFIFSPLAGILTRTYGYQGAFLVLSAILLNSLPASLLIRSVQRPLRTATEIKPSLTHRVSKLVTTLKDLLCHTCLLPFLLSNFITCLGYNAPYIFLIDALQSKQFEPAKGEYLISLIGVCSAVGRVIIGFIADFRWVNRLQFYNACLIIAGIASVVEGYLQENYVLHAVYAGVYGFFSGGYVALTSVAVVDIVGLDHLSAAFGLVLLFQGIATFAGPPLWGHMFDKTRSYQWPFACFGSLIALSGLMLIPLRCLKGRLRGNPAKALARI